MSHGQQSVCHNYGQCWSDIVVICGKLVSFFFMYRDCANEICKLFMKTTTVDRCSKQHRFSMFVIHLEADDSVSWTSNCGSDCNEGSQCLNYECWFHCLFSVKYERIKFLVIALQDSIEIYAWAPKPYHKFMAFKVKSSSSYFHFHTYVMNCEQFWMEGVILKSPCPSVSLDLW